MAEQTERPEDHTPPADGPVIGGCRLGSVLGRGGMGTVYRATQLALGREVAVKVVPASGAADADVARFQREARIAAKLDHPDCVPIYAAGEEEGVLYLVMKLIHGPNLGALVAREGPLAPERAVELVVQVAGALDAAHGAGLVHRDVKPSNVLIELRRDTERAYLSDFGLMRQAVDEHEITRRHEWVGTIDYASPEQLEGRTIDRRADVYALAGVLYTTLSGERPFPRDSGTATAWAHLNAPPPQLDGHPLDRVIARGMAKRPEDRYATAGELARAARAALAPPDQPTVALPAPPVRRTARRGWAAAAVLTIAAVVVAGVVVAISLSSGRSGTPHRAARTDVRLDRFQFTIPRDWRVTEADHSMGSFLRTEVAGSGGSQVVIIDRDPGEAQPPSTWAKSVEQGTSATAGYSFVSFSPATIDGRQAVVWKFLLRNDSPSAQVDVFQQLGSNGFAVLGQAGTISAATRNALAVAASLSLR
jgi:serine/threonine protein kinase